MKPTIKLIAFDLFGVVISEGHMVAKALMPLLPEGVEKKAVKAVYQQYTVGNISEKQFWSGIGQAGNTGLRQDFLDSFVLDPEIEAVNKKLSSRYQFAILSNLASDWNDVLSTKFGFDEDYSPKIISGVVKCRKPDPAIYRHLLQQSGYKAEEMVFIDDRLENLHTAHQLGMTTIHYQREEDAHEFQADYVIRQLGEMTELDLFA